MREKEEFHGGLYIRLIKENYKYCLHTTREITYLADLIISAWFIRILYL